MKLYIIYGSIISLLILIIFIILILKNKFKILSYKLNQADKKIKEDLNEKYETIMKIKEVFDKNNLVVLPNSINSLDKDNINTYKLDEELKKCDLPIFEIFEYNVNIDFSDEDNYLFNKYKKINIELTGTKRYFNKNADILNRLRKRKLVKPISMLFKIKEKENYNLKKEEILESL